MNELPRPVPDPSALTAGYAWLDALSLGVVAMTFGGTVVHANAEFLKIVGCESLAGRNVGEFAPALMAGDAEGRVVGAPTSDDAEGGARRTVRVRRAEGSDASFDVVSRAVDRGGEPLLVATFTPAVQQDEGAFAFRDVFENAPYGLALVALDGTIRRVNPRLCAMFDYEPGDLQGAPVEILAPHRVRGGHGALRAAYSERPTSRAMGEDSNLTGRKKDGVEFPVEIGICGVSTATGPMICASVIDITARKRSENSLRDANEQLEEFTNVAAHDLRAPIRGIGNLIDFVLEDYGETAPETVLRHIRRMRDRVVSMEHLIDDLLIYARASKGAALFEPIDLSAMAQALLETNPPPPGASLHIDIGSTPFEGARTPLLTVLRNLFSNAIKHHDREEMAISLKSRDEGDYVAIDVVDDGPGIPEAAQERVFKLFQTLTPAGKRDGAGGGGLGLAVAKRLVNQHGGRLVLISANGRRGCTFRIWWPRLKRTDYGG